MKQLPWNEDALVPAGGLFLTAGVDVQENRIECGVKAWGRDKQSWHVGYWVLKGDTSRVHGDAWHLLEQLLAKDFAHESGVSLAIIAMAVDTGYRSQTVYEFAVRHPQPAHGPSGSRIYAPRTVIPVRGDSDSFKLIASVSKTDAARKRQGVLIWGVGAPLAKQELYDWLRLPLGEEGQFPAGYCHFPEYERGYFQQVCSESRIVRPNGKVEWLKDPNVRNEALDVEVYSRLAASLYGLDRFNANDWDLLESQVKPLPVTPEPKAPVPVKRKERENRVRFRFEQ